MYLEPWQVFLGGCVIGTLISFIILTAIIVNVLGKIGFNGIRIEENSKKCEAEVEHDLITKICFILLAKGYFDEVDNDFMLDKVSFNLWKNHVEEQLTELEEEENKGSR